jgi:hypothetical protein
MSISSNSTFSYLLRQDVLFVSRNPMSAWFQAKSTSAPECNAYSNLIEAKTNLSALPQVSDIISIGYMESCHGNCLISLLAQILDVTTKLRRGFESVGGSTWNICLSRTRSMDLFPVERAAAEIEQPNVSMPWVQDQKTVPRGTECGRRCFAHHLVFEVPCVPCGTMWSPIVTKFVQEFFCST